MGLILMKRRCGFHVPLTNGISIGYITIIKVSPLFFYLLVAGLQFSEYGVQFMDAFPSFGHYLCLWFLKSVRTQR